MPSSLAAALDKTERVVHVLWSLSSRHRVKQVDREGSEEDEESEEEEEATSAAAAPSRPQDRCTDVATSLGDASPYRRELKRAVVVPSPVQGPLAPAAGEEPPPEASQAEGSCRCTANSPGACHAVTAESRAHCIHAGWSRETSTPQPLPQRSSEAEGNCCPAVVLPCCRTAVLPCCRTAVLLWCLQRVLMPPLLRQSLLSCTAQEEFTRCPHALLLGQSLLSCTAQKELTRCPHAPPESTPSIRAPALERLEIQLISRVGAM